MRIERAGGLPAGGTRRDELDAALLRERTRKRRLAGARGADEQQTAVDVRPRDAPRLRSLDVGDEVLADLTRLADSVQLAQARPDIGHDASEPSFDTVAEEPQRVVGRQLQTPRHVEVGRDEV